MRSHARGCSRCAAKAATALGLGDTLALQGVAECRSLSASPCLIVRCISIVWYMRPPYMGVPVLSVWPGSRALL